MYYRICPLCGAALDPGERCDCTDEKTAADGADIDDGKRIGPVNQTNQIRLYSIGWGKGNQV